MNFLAKVMIKVCYSHTLKHDIAIRKDELILFQLSMPCNKISPKLTDIENNFTMLMHSGGQRFGQGSAETIGTMEMDCLLHGV